MIMHVCSHPPCLEEHVEFESGREKAKKTKAKSWSNAIALLYHQDKKIKDQISNHKTISDIVIISSYSVKNCKIGKIELKNWLKNCFFIHVDILTTLSQFEQPKTINKAMFHYKTISDIVIINSYSVNFWFQKIVKWHKISSYVDSVLIST